MERSIQIAIEERAHQIWEAEGRPAGRALEHWERAKTELASRYGISTNLVEKEAVTNLSNLSQEQRQLVEEYFADVKRRRLIFLLAGKTGVGKSTTINTLLGKKVAEVSRLEPCTASVHPYPGKIGNIKYVVYDTPGLCDGKDKDEMYVEMMKEVKEVDCFWYVTRLDDHRVSKDEQLGMQSLTNDLGPDIWSHAVIIFTHSGNARKDFSTYFNERASILRRHIGANVPQAIAEKIPAVAVDNESILLPDGTHWLAELYTVVIERISAKGALSFALSLQDRVKKKDDEVTSSPAGSTYNYYSYVRNDNTHTTTVTSSAPSIPIDKGQQDRIDRKITNTIKKELPSFGERTGRAAAGAAAGAAIGAVVGGPVGAVVGGVVGGAVGWLSSIFGRKR